jgi:hypothetical protein
MNGRIKEIEMRVLMLTSALIAGISNTPLRSYAADAVPDFDISANCRTESPDSAGTGETLNKCINDERRAKQQVTQEWSGFALNDKTTCIKETNIDGTPSYVELQTCLEMAHDSRAAKGTNSTDQPRLNTK